ncbi:MAG: IS701 family transposase [Thermoplasmata archaeon]
MTFRRGLFRIGVSMKRLPGFFKGFSHHWGGWSRSKETKRAARNYLMGVLLPGKRKNMSGISRRVHLNPNIAQQFITDSPWDSEEVMATNTGTMSKIASKEGIWIVDDTGQEKKGRKSPGVSRQYSGTLGKTGNCQVFVGCWYSIPGRTRNADAVYWPTGMKLYIPEEWFEDEQRCEEARIPDDVEFQTKPEIALDLMERAREAHVPHRATTTDTAYGTDGKFRSTLRDWKEPYVAAVTPSHISVVPEDTPIRSAGTRSEGGRPRVHPGFPRDVRPRTADALSSEIPDEDWKEVEWSEGTKGKLSARFTRIRVRVAKKGRPTDETGWLLLERTRKGELKAYMCWGFDDATLEELVEIAHIRWVVEQGFKQMKGELGLDDFEGRKWIGWHHHAAMVMIAFSYLMLLRVEGNTSGEKLPTLPQVRREMLRIYGIRVLERKLGISPEEADSVFEDIPWLIPE